MGTGMEKGCFVCRRGSDRLDFVYGPRQREAARSLLEICPQVIHEDNLEDHRDFLRETRVLLCTWDMIPYTEEELAEYFPRLELVLYAAGSVQYFARPFLARGIRVLSAWGAMSLPVAQFTVSAIVLANKGAFLSAGRYRAGLDYGAAHRLSTEGFPGTYGTRVGILGAGMIGSQVIRMLRDYPVEVMVYDPFLPPGQAAELGAEPCGLEELFARCQTVSNHIANNEHTVGMLDYRLFRRMGKNAAFINTGRGAQVVEADLARALREEPDRCAILDVTWPEPMEPANPLWGLPNAVIFPHIAGYASREVHAMPDCMLEQLRRYLAGEAPEYEVTLPMLETMA